MPKSQLFDPVRVLYSSGHSVIEDAALICDGHLIAFGDAARAKAKELGLDPTSNPNQLLAPCLVDPHSFLEEPISGRSETLITLRKTAANAGYGHLALLPRSPSWRDRPERLTGFKNPQSDVIVDLWGSFSRNGEGNELTSHADLLQHGAVGLAEDDYCLPPSLLKQGLVLGEMGSAPVLIAPKDEKIQGNGMVREGVETLRAGWAPDPIASETLPLGDLLELYRQHPECSLRIMNLATASGVAMITSSTYKPMASVCWWHLVADRSVLDPTNLGWRISPSLGGPQDREALAKGLIEGALTAIAVHAFPLDEEDTQLPPDLRLPGLAGHQMVLPALWQELIVKSGWSIEQLWQALSFGPSKMLNRPEERLACGSRRWLLFNPDLPWIQDRGAKDAPSAANQPWQGKQLIGKIITTGLRG